MGQLGRAIILIAAAPVVITAKIVKFEIVKVEWPAFEGRAFGTVGTYDRILAGATIAVTPDDPHNKIIVDLDRAPRNAQGQVEATTDVEILRPTIPAEERLKNNDPRLSMAERYPNDGDRAAAITEATQQLVRDRLVLEEDAGLFVAKSN